MSLAKRHAVVTGSTSGIGLAIARALAKEGANVIINGFGDAEEIEKERAGIEANSASRRSTRRRHDQGGRDRRHDRRRGGEARLGRHPGQQRRHPVRLADRGFPAREVGPDHRHQPVVRLPRHPRRRSGHEGAEMGPDHQHRLGPLAGRLAVQVGLCRRQARHRRPDQDGRAGGRRPSASPATASAPAMSGRRWSRTRSPTP